MFQKTFFWHFLQVHKLHSYIYLYIKYNIYLTKKEIEKNK